jgi:hypothetical protein
MSEHAGTPIAWHQRFVQLTKANHNEQLIASHESWCKLIEISLTYDQLAGGALASCEFAGRQVQLIEERYKDKVFGHDDSGLTAESRLFSGSSDRAGLCICPKLTEWIAEELKKESAVLKERRKAREERLLSKPKGGKDKT